jgi:hypothetical protein
MNGARSRRVARRPVCISYNQIMNQIFTAISHGNYHDTNPCPYRLAHHRTLLLAGTQTVNHRGLFARANVLNCCQRQHITARMLMRARPCVAMSARAYPRLKREENFEARKACRQLAVRPLWP